MGEEEEEQEEGEEVLLEVMDEEEVEVEIPERAEDVWTVIKV